MPHSWAVAGWPLPGSGFDPWVLWPPASFYWPQTSVALCGLTDEAGFLACGVSQVDLQVVDPEACLPG